MNNKNLSIQQKVKLLVDAIDDDQGTNEALSKCANGEAMVNILFEVSFNLRLGLSRKDLIETSPIRDWVWWKNKQSLVTLGDGTLRHQQDMSNKTRWDSWTIGIFKFFRRRQ